MVKTGKILLIAVFSMFTLALVVTSHTFAATVSGLTIYPIRAEPSILPGTVYSGELSIDNTTRSPMTIEMSAASFDVTDERYDYSFDSQSKLAAWVRFDPSAVILQPGKSQSINYKISVPIGAEPHGQYISLFATSNKQQLSDGITTQERVASLLYITIQGDVTRQGKLLSLHSPWVLTGNDSWTAELQNTGTTHYKSVYTVTTKTLFNTTTGVNSTSKLILPASVRLIEGKVSEPRLFGIYKIVYSVGLGDNPAYTTTRYVLALPNSPVAVILAIILILVIARGIIGARRIYRKRKLHKNKD